MTVRSSEAGFTLVEMLVALTIFALLAAAGVGLLRASVDTQAAVTVRLADLAEAARLRSLLASDLAQAVTRDVREGGAERPAFLGLESELRLVRAGWTDPAGGARPDLQAVRWAAAGGRLVRAGRAELDGGPELPEAELADGLASARFRYRDESGGWRSDWSARPGQSSFPRAVELTLQRSGEAPVTMVMTLPEGPAPDPVPLPGASA